MAFKLVLLAGVPAAPALGKQQDYWIGDTGLEYYLLHAGDYFDVYSNGDYLSSFQARKSSGNTWSNHLDGMPWTTTVSNPGGNAGDRFAELAIELGLLRQWKTGGQERLYRSIVLFRYAVRMEGLATCLRLGRNGWLTAGSSRRRLSDTPLKHLEGSLCRNDRIHQVPILQKSS